MKRIFQSLLLLLFTSQVVLGQTNEEKAKEKAKEAIQLMDNGQVEASIPLLQQAQELDGNNPVYPYEIALAHYMLKDYKTSIQILEKLLKHKDVFDRVYQMLGNNYDMRGDAKKAIATYEKGLNKFPSSGILHLELGVMHLKEDKNNEALTYFEKGINLAPQFSSNYYWAAKLFFGSSEKLWGMLYGEIFMNLERGSKRTEEISKLLFETYKSQIQFTSDTSFSVSFSKNATLSLSDLKNFKLPYSIGIYEPTLTVSLISEKRIDLSSLHRIRQNFIQLYFQKDFNKSHPNLLFDYQQQLLNLGYLEAYNYWILSQGNTEEFNSWASINKEKWDSFIAWFSENGLQVDLNNKFHRRQY